ncbi:MAG: ThiF family adenylyltransferase [Alphaproteobacteria bacterium]|nr:ThiF family adenylyltransferase [Alphaproteobacteria bacterium]
MSEHESRARYEAERRGWTIERRPLEIGALGVPCFVSPHTAGECNIWVGIAPDSDDLKAVHEWQQGALHTANIRGLPSRKLYDRSGTEFTNGMIGHSHSGPVLSIKLRGRDYEDAWEALNNYVKQIYALFLGQAPSGRKVIPRPYTFDILGDQLPEAMEWRGLVTKERVAIIGLGGVGAWIADFVVKADPWEVHGWDYDCIESKNILRMPGGSDPNVWIGRPKADWFQETYSLIHTNVHGYNVKVVPQNVQEVIEKGTFAFVAVDDADDRMMVCDALAGSGVPFVVVGLSPVRKDKRVKISMRIVTAHVGVSSWRQAIPQVGQAGQDDYGSVDLPDVYSMAAGWAVQSWRKMRGQFWQKQREECLHYDANDQSLILRGV